MKKNKKAKKKKSAQPSHSWRSDLAAGILFLCGLFLAMALVSQPSTKSGSVGSEGALLGDVIAGWLILGLGTASYILLPFWFVFCMMVLKHGKRWPWARRSLGWLLLIPCFATVAEHYSVYVYYLVPTLCPLTGAGGSIGASLHLSLSSVVGVSLTGVVLWGAMACCLIVALDRHVVLLARVFVMALIGVLTYVGAWFTEWITQSEEKPRQKKPKSSPLLPTIDEDDEEEEEEDQPDWLEEEFEDEEEEAPDERIIPIHHHDELSGAGRKRKWGFLPFFGGKSQEEEEPEYELPTTELLDEPEPFPHEEHDLILRERASLLEKTYRDFGINIRVVGINTGPVITQYEVALEKGLRVHKVTRLADDVALNLCIPSVRMVAPIPGKSTVGIETPNEHRALVRLKEVMDAAGEKTEKYKIPVFLGKDAEGRPLIQDLADMPHLLIAGRTGTGKSVCMNALILSMLMTRRPDEVKMIMIDPKMLEMSEYGTIPHLMHPVVKDMKKAEAILSWAVDKMEERYDLLSRARARSIAEYNKLSYSEILKRVKPADEEEQAQIPEQMPYIVIFVDEMADLIMMMKKEVEGHIIRLAQKSRAAGIHLVVATQKPTVDVITGLIKSNLPARICFKVVNKSDSRVVLDEMGADKLLGKGDMLFQPPNASTLTRAQCTYVDGEEIAAVVDQWSTVPPCFAEELLHLSTSKNSAGLVEHLRERDELYEAAIEVVVREQRGSVSLLQRSLGIGYGRAARLIDFMAEDGIVGAYNGSSARDVLHTPESWEALKDGTLAG